jgi:cyanophycin synthetase
MTLVATRTYHDEGSERGPIVPELPVSFRAWRAKVIKTGHLPIIGVAGLRGKTTIIHLVDHILRTSGNRTAVWTSNGVEIDGRSQQSELGAWKDAMRRLIDGDVSIALQELDAATVLATGLPAQLYPVLAITNICGNDEVCHIHREAQLAMKAMPRLLQAVSPEGALVVNGEDFTLVNALQPFSSTPTVFYSLSRNAPLLRQQLAQEGFGVWRDDGNIRFGASEDAPITCRIPDLPYTLNGDAAFQVTNVLAAVAIARLVGLTPTEIEIALHSYTPHWSKMPGTMAVEQHQGARVIVDRPDPSWFLRPVLRAIRSHSRGRLFVVTGRMESVPMDDIEEVGRMLGRNADAIVLHDHHVNPARAEILLKGVSRVLDPPLVVRVNSETRAIQSGIRRLRAGDMLLVLADDPAKALATVQRAGRARAHSPGTAQDAAALDDIV